jgi:Rieske 2Fe-2S family protein
MTAEAPDAGYTGLRELQQGLPRGQYTEAVWFERELEAIWYRNWNYVCLEQDLAGPRAYQVTTIGSQQVIVLRDEAGELRAFYNTCRHRGSQLLQQVSGTLNTDSLVCPYHAWSYSLQGALKRIPSAQRPVDFDESILGLYPVSIQTWRGLIFINLDAQPAALEHSFDFPQALANWPLESLQTGFTWTKTMDCNWKVFWENYSECLHCPGVHPELSRLVPLYREFKMTVADAPDWRQRQATDPGYRDGLREGARTWSHDGQLVAPVLDGLTEADISAGHTFVTALPTAFIVAHADYVRIVRLLPLAANRTELTVQWLFAPEVLSDANFDAAAVASFACQVMEQDARVAELNQRGLYARPHQAGVLLPEEYEVHQFQQWVRGQLLRVEPADA